MIYALSSTTIRVPPVFPDPNTFPFLLLPKPFLWLSLFFFCLPKKVVFSFMFGSILSLNSPIYFTSQLINQDYQSFLFLCFHKGHLSMWLHHLSTSFLLYLLGAIVWTLSSGPLLWSFSTAVIIMCWYSCNEIHLSSLLWILISWCVHACVFILVFSCYFCLRISWQHK